MKNILVPTDFSDLSLNAKNLANIIAKHTGAILHFIKVIQTSSDIALNHDGDLLDSCATDQTFLIEQKKEALAAMEDFTKDITQHKITKIGFGHVQQYITQYQQANNIDLVVMATHGVSGLKEFISGSVTEHVTLKSPVPVLSLKCDRSNIDFSDLMITGEFQALYSKDIEIIKMMQNVFKSKLHLLAVNTQKNYLTTSEWLKKMNVFTELHELNNPEYHIHNDKTLEDGIVNFCNNYDATHTLDLDIIAVQKNKKSDLGYLLTGCTATRLINHIYRPLITYQVEK